MESVDWVDSDISGWMDSNFDVMQIRDKRNVLVWPMFMKFSNMFWEGKWQPLNLNNLPKKKKKPLETKQITWVNIGHIHKVQRES